jgi:hypothetical protein
MLRPAILATLAVAACGRQDGVSDHELGSLVVAPKDRPAPIELARAVRDPAELGRALALPHREVAAALGPHSVGISSSIKVEEAGATVDELSDHTTIELGEGDTFHARHANSADYGREVTYLGGVLYLRPRYQRWHRRAPETPDEPRQLRESFYAVIGATWELIAPGAELTDQGTAEVAGRTGKKIAVKLAPSPRPPAKEPLAHRAWREKRSVDALSGEVVLDADSGVPLRVKLDGTVGFSRDGRRFAMTIAVDSALAAVGHPAELTEPPADQVVTTPERLREVDDRDFLLQGLAPPLRQKPQVPAPPGRAAPAGGSAESRSAGTPAPPAPASSSTP